ncbi:MAG: DUF1343 domain-containing protein [Acidobacteria bacterium]|nr:DUF1343 domain-containing protein [Acidobacteriota bacterium]
MNIVVTDRAQLRAVQTGVEIAAALRKLFPADWKVDSYSRLLANAAALERLKRGDTPEEIARSWQSKLDEFRRARARALIYR